MEISHHLAIQVLDALESAPKTHSAACAGVGSERQMTAPSMSGQSTTFLSGQCDCSAARSHAAARALRNAIEHQGVK